MSLVKKAYSKKVTKPVEKQEDIVKDLKDLSSRYDDLSFVIREQVGKDAYDSLEGISEQCGMSLISGLNKVNAKNQALALLGAFMSDDGYVDDDITEIGLKPTVSQIVISDVVPKNGIPSPADKWYTTKAVAIKYGTAGPLTVNPNTKRSIRHFTITMDMLVDIYNRNH